MACISTSSMVRHDICRHNYAVERGLVASVVNHIIVTDSTIQKSGIDLPSHTWSLLNRFQTGQDPCRANLYKWSLAQSPSCDCGQHQTMNHIVDTCPLTKFEGGLNLLHDADNDAIIWLEFTATAACAKWKCWLGNKNGIQLVKTHSKLSPKLLLWRTGPI